MASGKHIELLKQGIAAAKSGETTRARSLIQEATEVEPSYELGWLWFASLAPDAKSARAALGRVLQINPENAKARRWLDKIESRSRGGKTAFRCPLCGEYHDSRPSRCAGCGATLTFADLEAFFDPPVAGGAGPGVHNGSPGHGAFGSNGSGSNGSDSSGSGTNGHAAGRNGSAGGQGGAGGVRQPADPFQRGSADHVDRERIGAAVERLRQAEEGEPESSRQWTLGLACMNLRRYGEALEHLRTAADLKPEDEALASLVEDLRRRLAEPDPESDCLTTAVPELAADTTSRRAGGALGAADSSLTLPVAQPAGLARGASSSGIGSAARPAAALSVSATSAGALATSAEPAGAMAVSTGAMAESAGAMAVSTGAMAESAGAMAVSALPATAADAQRVVLIVDDSPTVRKLVALTLERQRYRVLVASDGMEGLARLQDAVPDLILLDINMPHLDGYKLCRVIKDNTLTREVPVVMLSGKDGFIDKVRGRMAGAVDYITKPIDPASLVRTIERHFVG